MLELNFSQTQRQTLKLTQSLRLSLDILQKNTVELERYLRDQSEKNPLMLVSSNFEGNGIDLSRLSAVSEIDLYRYLDEQANESHLAPLLYHVVRCLIEEVDKSGFLQINRQQFCNEHHISSETLEHAIATLKGFQPLGVGAESIQECFIIQAKADPSAPAAVIPFLQDHYKQMLAQNWPQIKRELRINQPELNEIVGYLSHLNMRPGDMDQKPAAEIVPDLLFQAQGSHYQLALNAAGGFQIAFDTESVQGLNDLVDQETKDYIRQERKAVTEIQLAVKHRADTLLAIGRELVKCQFGYLVGKQKFLNPLTMTGLAERLKINVSTVSRALAGKYLQTDRQILALSELCTSHVTDSSIKTRPLGKTDTKIQEIVQRENPLHPLSDAKIKAELSKCGIDVSRRSVTKIRERLGIKSSLDRRNLSKEEG